MMQHDRNDINMTETDWIGIGLKIDYSITKDRIDNPRIFESSYMIHQFGSHIRATNGTTGIVSYSGTDVKTVIQTALNSLPPGRTYKEKITIKGNFTITSGISIPSYTIVEIIGTLTRSGNGFHMFSIDSKSNVEITGGRIVSSAKAAEAYDTNEIHIIDSNDIIIKNMRIDNAAEDGIMVRGSSYNIKVDKCSFIDSNRHAVDILDTSHHITISNNYVNGIVVYDGITLYLKGGNTITVVGNVVENIHGSAQSSTAIHVEDAGASPDYNNISVTGNSIYNCKQGITVATARPVAIVGNTIRNTERGLQLMHPTNSSFTGNVIDNSEQTATNYGIYLYGASKSCFTGNSIRGNALYTTGIYHDQAGLLVNNIFSSNIIDKCLYGIYNPGESNIFSTNEIINCGRHGIYFHVSAQYNLIESNFFKNNGQEADDTYSDIYVDSLEISNTFGLHFIGNMSLNDAATNRISYHINFTAFTNFMVITGCRSIGQRQTMINTAPSSSIIKNNHGYVTENDILSPTFTIDSTGVKTVTIAHGMSITPNIQDCHITVIENTAVDDWAYNLLKVVSVDATNVVAKINVSTASANVSATAKLSLRI